MEEERGPCNVIFRILAAISIKILHYIFQPEVRMQSKNTITIVHVMSGMCGIHT